MFFKVLFISFISIFSIIYYWLIVLLSDGVTATLKVPVNIKPGETVVAEVIINKGNTGGFAKLQIEVAPGLSIAEEDSKGATFSFSGNTAKWIWTALPMEAEFKVKFKVTASTSASGKKEISGKFSYIVNNAKQVAEIPTQTIDIRTTIEPLAQTNPTSNVSAHDNPTPVENDNTDIAITYTANANVSVNSSITPSENAPLSIKIPTTNITLNRKIENLSPRDWLIKITINKGNIKGFARYTDVLPTGLTAKAEEKDGSSFFIDGSSIKFVWSNVPEKETLVISYKLSGNLTSVVTLNGDFSFTENNQVVSKSMEPQSIQPDIPVSTVNNSNVTKESIAETSMQARQTVVFFSVQLGAFMKSKISANYFIRKYNIKNVVQENHELYKKFYSGNYEQYKDARDYREEIKIKGIQDAFVIAHKNNIRITVQEALMITNQKWYP